MVKCEKCQREFKNEHAMRVHAFHCGRKVKRKRKQPVKAPVLPTNGTTELLWFAVGGVVRSMKDEGVRPEVVLSALSTVSKVVKRA